MSEMIAPWLRTARLILLAAALGLALGAHAADERTLRVMTYNIHHGEGIDQKFDLERIARLIRDARADIVGLQEVDRGCERTQKRDLAGELAQLTGMKAHFEKNIDYQGGEYGNAVLTRFPIKRAMNTHFRRLGEGEQRGVMQLLLDVNGRDVLFMNTHLDHRRDEAERISSAEELKGIVSRAGKVPVILVGDFNAAAASRTHESIKSFLLDSWEIAGKGDGFTIPVAKPSRRIDYIFVSRDSIEPRAMEVLHSLASDHLPLVAELRLK
jgi:endonuclease/exonuclease/phosphatase family metal-dependent hydrolase